MFESIRKIHQAFDQKGLKHLTEEKNGSWIIFTGMNGEEGNYRFLYVKDDDTGNDVAVRCMTGVNVPRNRVATVLAMLNEFQQQYRYLKFTLDKDNDVMVSYDFPVAYSDIGAGGLDMLFRMTAILDKCYPQLMQAIR